LRQTNDDIIQNCHSALANEHWEEIYKQDNINNNFNTFLNTFLIKYENSFPVTQRRYANNVNKWITTEIRIFCKGKRSLYILIKRSHNRAKSIL
jgi:hypothetical protein